MCMHVFVHERGHVHVSEFISGDQKALDLLDLRLQILMNYLTYMQETRLQSSVRSIQVLKHCYIYFLIIIRFLL